MYLNKEIYRPELLSELEYYYNDIFDFINNDIKILNIYGDIGCGKTTIVKLYLNKSNINYIILEDYNLTNNSINDFFNQLTEINILSYFNNCTKQLIIIDNYDNFSFNFLDIINKLNFKFIIISQQLHFKNNIHITNPSRLYIEGLYNSIKNYSDNKINNISFDKCNNFLKFYNLLFNFDSVFDDFLNNKTVIKKIYKEKNLNLNNYDINIVHNNYLNSCYDLETCVKCSDILYNSLFFICTDYYQIINNFLIVNLNKSIDTTISTKLNYHKKSKIIKECIKNSCSPLELCYIKNIKNKK